MSSLLESIFGRNITARQIAIVSVGVVVTALVYFVSRIGGEPTMMPLFSDVPLAQVSAMTDKLTELSIPYTLSESGTAISVSPDNLAKARVALAKDGLPNAGRPGMELFDKATWGMTDFTQKVNYGRALEGELERTISSMRDVDKVQVHLALEDDALFKQNERPSKASVTLIMKGGEAPQRGVVRGIASLVAGSIGGLDPQHVTIVDEHGNGLTSDDDGTSAGLTSRQLEVQNDIELRLQKKAESLLRSVVGTGNSTVEVTANINFDKLQRTTQAVDPEKQATASEQKAEVTPGTPQQGAGYNTSAISYDNSKTVESFVSSSGNIRKLTVAVAIADKSTMPVLDTAAKTKVAPTPIITPRTPEELAKIETLIRSALGVDSTRGDQLTVVSAPFDHPVIIASHDSMPTPTLITRLQSNPKPPLAIGAFAVLLIVAVVMMISLKPKKIIEAPVQPQLLAANAAYPELQSPQQQQQLREANQQRLDEEEYGAEQAKTPYRLPAIATSPEREQAIATVEQRPEAAVRVTKNWLRA